MRPGSLEEACALLAQDADTGIIAGGQSLVPMLAMRLARPARLVDIVRLPELSGIRNGGSHIVIGATTRQAAAEAHPLIVGKVPLLKMVMPWIGHAATRARGTVGGSIAHADPSAEIPLVAATLEAEIVVQDVHGETAIAASEFFVGPMVTAIPQGALVREVRMPVWTQPRIGSGFHEVNARHSDFALVCAAAQVGFDDQGRCTACAVGVGGLGEYPIALKEAAAALIETTLGETAVTDAVEAAMAKVDVFGDLHATADYRRRVGGVLARRALVDARKSALEGLQ